MLHCPGVVNVNISKHGKIHLKINPAQKKPAQYRVECKILMLLAQDMKTTRLKHGAYAEIFVLYD
jgi:hypothetical protein